ncbi:MAG: GGDEF domain-containing protein [Hominilimicola sp.]
MEYFISDDYTVYNSLPCGAVIFTIGENYDIVYSNYIYNNLFESDSINVHPVDRNTIREALKTAKVPMRLPLRCADKNGEYIYVQMFVVRDGSKALALIIDDTDNILAMQKLRDEEKKLREKALIDPLSKVYNRATAVEKINNKLARLNAYEECALIVLDIDNFKNINDNFGHLYGDAVITMASGSIKSILDNDDILGRFGGDEFFIFVSNKGRDVLERKLESIRLAILKMRLDKNDENDISCSMGVAFGHAGVTYEELFRQADSALYTAKLKGKNRFEIFNGRYSDKITLSYAGAAGEIKDNDESGEAHDITAVALEIASKSTSTENAVSNLMRHIGVAANLDCIQVMKFDTLADKVYLEFQWWKEHDGLYNVVFTETKSGYYVHSDLMIFRERFRIDKIFQYKPDFKKGFSKKYKDVFDNSAHINSLYSSNTENEDIFYVVTYQSWNKGRIWTQKELIEMSEITKIISMFMKSVRITTEREKLLEDRINHSRFGLYSINKFYEEAGRINREAICNNEKIAMAHFDIKHLYRFSRTYGIKEGDKVLEEFAAFLLKADDSRAITCHLSGTDMFICLFRYNPECDVREIIECEITRFCDRMGEYKEFPLIIKAGLCFFELGQPVARAIDIAKELKYGIDFDKCMCISRKMLPTEAII